MSNKHSKYMVGKPITMHQIKQIIELLSKNYGVRTIVRLCGISPNTVRDNKWLVEQSKIPFEQLLLLDNDSLANLINGKDPVLIC